MGTIKLELFAHVRIRWLTSKMLFDAGSVWAAILALSMEGVVLIKTLHYKWRFHSTSYNEDFTQFQKNKVQHHQDSFAFHAALQMAYSRKYFPFPFP